jgi:O-antigen ligase
VPGAGNTETVQPLSAGTTAIAVVVTIALALVGAATGQPLIALACAAAIAVLALAFAFFGKELLVLGLLALVPVIPVVDYGLLGSLGSVGNQLRAPFIAVCLLGACLFLFSDFPRPPVGARRVIAAFLLVAGAGVVGTIINSDTATGILGEVVKAAGQPAIYALALAVFVTYAHRGASRADLMLGAICVGVILEAGIVALELATGNAFDALRGITRANGTIGANFLSALGMLGFLAALSLWERRPETHWRNFSAISMAAGIAILFAGISRGAVIALLLGATYLVLTSDRVRLGPALVVGSVVGALAIAFGSFYADRFERGITDFDRTETWVAGLRIAEDNPIGGVGSDEVVTAIEKRPDYYETPFGKTTVIPHNMWILGFAESGILYFLALVILAGTFVWAIATRPRPPTGRAAGERPLVAAMIGFGVLCAINNMFTHPELVVLVVAMLAILLTPEARTPERTPSRAHA